MKGVLYDAARGHVDPSGVTHAFAKGARDRGAEIVRHCPVLETNPRRDGAWEVVTAQGTVVAEHVVNAAGLWAREVGALAGIRLPLMPVEHHYLVTESIPEIEAMERELPLMSDADAEFYMRQEGQGLLLGVYESPCTHWAVEGDPAGFRPRAAARRPRAHGAQHGAGGGERAGARAGGDQADGQRPDDFLPGPQSAGRSLSGLCATTGARAG